MYENSYESLEREISKKNIVPPWCSSARNSYKSKRRRVTPWESKTCFPRRENIWKYLQDGNTTRPVKKTIGKGLNKEKLMTRSGNGHRKYLFLVLIFVAAAFYIMPDEFLRKDLMGFFSDTRLISTDIPDYSVSKKKNCNDEIRFLSFTLSRTQQMLRKTFRLRNSILPGSELSRPDDTTGLISGATVVIGSNTKEWEGRVVLWGIIPLWKYIPPLNIVLKPRQATPSDCWPFKGSYGEIIIKLPQRLQVDRISVEHIRPDIARSAPKNFIVFGVLSNRTFIKVLEGIYKTNNPAKQFFSLKKKLILDQIAVRVLSNQGNPNYTCIYRIHLYTIENK